MSSKMEKEMVIIHVRKAHTKTHALDGGVDVNAAGVSSNPSLGPARYTSVTGAPAMVMVSDDMGLQSL